MYLIIIIVYILINYLSCINSKHLSKSPSEKIITRFFVYKKSKNLN